MEKLITRKEAESILKSGSTKAYRLLTELCDEGKLEISGNGRLRQYLPE